MHASGAAGGGSFDLNTWPVIWIRDSGASVAMQARRSKSRATPKAVTLHERRCIRTGGLWRCHGTVDI